MTNKVVPWVFPPDTTCIPDEQYIDLDVIDLSVFSDEPEQGLVSQTINALHTTGFIAVKGHGLSTNDIHRQFDLGRLLNEDVSEEEKHQLHAKIEEGNWAGYKPKGYYPLCDYMEHYGFYPSTALESCLPNAAKPYLDEFRQFIRHNHYVILHKILAIISLGLGLKREFLWKLHHRDEVPDDGSLQGPAFEVKWKHSKDHLRYTMYHPPSEEDRDKKRFWLPGHTDPGSITFLYSQPVAGLQLRTPDGEWRYIRHYPDHIIVDIGDSMEFITGGLLRAAPHRVVEPPEDQRHLKRLGVFFFVPLLPEVKLGPVEQLLSLGAKDIFEEYYQLDRQRPITAAEWHVFRAKLVGMRREKRKERKPVDVLQDIYFKRLQKLYVQPVRPVRSCVQVNKASFGNPSQGCLMALTTVR